MSAVQVLEQAAAALWLLCNFGGIGSKSRKGFGSPQVVHVERDDAGPFQLWAQIDDCRAVGAVIRQALGLIELPEPIKPLSSALARPSELPDPVKLDVPWNDPWKILDEIGFAYQAFAKAKKHDRAKAALGLPRKIHGPRDAPMQNQNREDWKAPEWLVFPKRDLRAPPRDARHASPVHLHVARDSSGAHVVRAMAFPAAYLPDLATSRGFLVEFLQFFENELRRRAALAPPPRPAKEPRPPDRKGERPAPRPTPPPAPRHVSVPAVTVDQLKARLAELPPTESLFRIRQAQGSNAYEAQRLRLAPSVPAGFQSDGGHQVTKAPSGLAEGVIVLVRGQGRQGDFVSVFGQVPPPSGPPQRPGGSRRR